VHHLGDINPRIWRNKFAPVLQSLAPELEAKIENLNAAISAQQGGSGVDSE
jgi:cytochrome c biogenesis protein CcmG/thiol:disulfide interchange protein DsbE